MSRFIFALALLVASVTTGASQGHPELINDFFQGNVTVDSVFEQCTNDRNQGNCATIAVIKAALAEFGTIDGIFTTFQRDGDSIRCTFRDGTTVAVGRSERDIVRQTADLRPGNTPTFREDAITLYALISKRMLVRRSAFTPSSSFTKCVRNYRDVVMYLNSGYPSIHAYRLLALTTIDITDFAALATTPSAIVYSKGIHAGFCTMGQQDQFGDVFPIERERGRNNRPTGAWLMGTANGNRRKITAAYRLALP